MFVKGEEIYGEVIHPVLLDTSLIRCSESMSEKIPLGVG